MGITKRIYISMPDDKFFPAQKKFKWAIIDKIKREGYLPELFLNPEYTDGSIASGLAWSPERALALAKRCVGAAIFVMPQWKFKTRRKLLTHRPHALTVPKQLTYIPSELNAYDGALAHTHHLPMLLIARNDISQISVFDDIERCNYSGNGNLDLLRKPGFTTPFNNWLDKLADKKKDVFLGYCSKSSATAKAIIDFLTNDLGISVLDWQTHFPPANSVLVDIIAAARECSLGIFLFTKDDELATPTNPQMDKAAPRDNVIFEAGYFINAKEKSNVLVIREDGAKVPADLGGDIYAALADKDNIDPIKDSIRAFIRSYNERPLIP